MGTIIVGAVVLVLVLAAVVIRIMIHNKKNGKGCCGNCGSCSGCHR